MLTPSQTQVVERVLVEEDRNRAHLVVAVSGAHACGFPSRDSDSDLKGVHVLPTEAFLGLSQPALHAERMQAIDGVEIDYSSNEIQAALAGVLGGNGNSFLAASSCARRWRRTMVTIPNARCISCACCACAARSSGLAALLRV